MSAVNSSTRVIVAAQPEKIIPAVPEVSERVITLTLTEAEAAILYRLFYYHVPGRSELYEVLKPLGQRLSLPVTVNGKRAPIDRLYGTSEVTK